MFLPLKIITFNLYLLCIGPECLLREVPDVEKRQPMIAQWLKEQNADIVFLQEVWQADQFDYLKKESGYPYGIHFGPKSEMAVLSRYPITDADYIPNRWQGSYVEDCKKGVVGYRYGLGLATVDVNGTEIVIANAHPIARRSDIAGFHEPADRLTPERKMLLLEYWLLLKERIKTKPMIFAGDFNMNHQSDEYAFFKRLFGLSDTLNKKDNRICSYCESNIYAKKQGSSSEDVIDHIFINRYFEPVSAQIDFPNPDLSDHQPVTATIVLNNPGRGGPVPVRRSTSEGGWPPKKGQPHGVAPTKNEIDHLIRYFEKVPLSPYCYLSYELGWKQKEKTLEFLKKLRDRQETSNESQATSHFPFS